MVNYCDIPYSDAPICWSDAYKIGVGQIDEEHEKLFRAYQSFIDSFNGGGGLDAVKNALVILENYISYHFTSEEELMISINYPDLFVHKLEHLDFQVSIARFKASVLAGEDVNQDFVRFFGHWLIAHVTIMDQRIGEFLQGVAA